MAEVIKVRRRPRGDNGHEGGSESGRMPHVGAVIYRPIHKESGELVFAEYDTDFFKLTSKASLMCRAVQTVKHKGRQVYLAQPHSLTGVVCFVDTNADVPEGWTHAEVIGHSNSGNCCFIRPIAGDMHDAWESQNFKSEE